MHAGPLRHYGPGMASDYSWSELRRSDIKELGRSLVERRLEECGCRVVPDHDARSGLLVVHGLHSTTEVYVSTQRVGGYAFWTKRRLEPAPHRFAALVLLDDGHAPALYCIPTIDWLEPSPPLTSRDYIGKASEPEYGIEINTAALPALNRYAWTAATERRLCR